jgi:histidine triad (HIT) family protein
MSSVFAKIIQGHIPCYKIAEDNNYFAFLDISPVSLGHTLVVSKREEDYLFDMDDNELSGFLPFCKKVSRAIEAVVPCKRVGLAVVGFEIPHAHIHLIPMQSLKDFSFTNPKLDLSNDVLIDLAEKIRAEIK